MSKFSRNNQKATVMNLAESESSRKNFDLKTSSPPLKEMVCGLYPKIKKTAQSSSVSHPCLFVRVNHTKLLVIIYVYDDLVTGSNKQDILHFDNKFNDEFKVTVDSPDCLSQILLCEKHDSCENDMHVSKNV